jgi:chemotaxis protein histidine kinase CheA
MPQQSCREKATIQIRVVESCGMAIALPAADVIDVQPLTATPEMLEQIGDLSVMHLDGRTRPVVSLQRALCLEPPADRAAPENQIVVLQVGTQRFGLLAERAHAPEQVEILPTTCPAHHLAVFSMMVQRGDEIAFVLNPLRLARFAGDAPMLDVTAAA